MATTHAAAASSSVANTEGRSDLPLRLGAALVGGALLAISRGREQRGTAAGVAGAILAGYALRPVALAALVAAGLDRQHVVVHRAFDVTRPVHEMFVFFRDFENFSHLIEEIHCVEDFQDGRSHWEIRSPDGKLVAWDAVVTKYLPNAVIAWQSVAGSVVQSSGIVRFSPLSDGGTHLDIHMEYRPLHASLRAAVRALFAPHPSARIAAELSQSRAYLEAMPPEPDVAAE
jgi:uncharacterized membrane protein